MALNDTIPIVVGVTGHRDLRPEDSGILTAAVQKELEALRSACPHSRIVLMSSLASGADQLCAKAAKALSIPLIAVLPMALSEYEKDFSGQELETLRDLSFSAAECFTAPETEALPSAADRDFSYRQAGIYIASHAHILLALWDGKESPATGCGTAAAVQFALNSTYIPKNSLPLGGNCPVVHIQAPRICGKPDVAGEVRFLGERSSFDEILRRTDEFNRLSLETPASEEKLLPTDREPDPKLTLMESLYGKADALSLRFAGQYRRILAALAVISTGVTAAFLLYDEAELHWMILVCGFMLLLAWLIQHFGKRSSSHQRYLEYRMLAEGCRVQAFLRYAGSSTAVSDILPWSSRSENGWVASSLKVLAIGNAASVQHSICTPWVREQHAYHARSITRSKRTGKGSERIIRVALWISILLYFMVLIFELVFGGLLPVSLKIADTGFWRTLSKLLLGSISAATLFISNYYGRLSLSRVTSDHIRMERFYASVLDRIGRYGESEELLTMIAREELVENINWCSYQRENTADFNL